MFWLWLTSLHWTQTFYSANLYVLNRFTENPPDNFKLRGNLSFTLCLKDNLTMTNFLHYLPTLRWAELLILNMFSKVLRGQIKKVMNFTSDFIYVDMAY